MNTIIIAQVLGIFFAVMGLSMVVNSKAVARAVEASVQDKGSLFLWGIIALLIGATIVAFDSAWTSGIAPLVTILGWIALLKAAFILILPDAAASLYKRFNKSGMLVLCGIVALVLGFFLIYG
jgi:hypothetical protein